MSQEKVNKYKEEKANRKKEVAKKKMQKKIYAILGVLLGVAFVAWIGISIFLEVKADREYESKVKAQSEAWEEYLEQLATATTSGTQGTTGDATTSSDQSTTAGDETTTGEETTSEEETTTSATE